MDKKPSLKEVRAYTARMAREARAWEALEEFIGNAKDIDSVIAGRQAELDGLDKAMREAKAALEAKKQEIAKVISQSQSTADAIVADARTLRTDAENRAKTVDSIIANAHSEAEAIIAQARETGKALAEQLGGKIPQLQKEIADAKAERTRIENDVAALEKRRDKANAELEELRGILGASVKTA